MSFVLSQTEWNKSVPNFIAIKSTNKVTKRFTATSHQGAILTHHHYYYYYYRYYYYHYYGFDLSSDQAPFFHTLLILFYFKKQKQKTFYHCRIQSVFCLNLASNNFYAEYLD